MLHRAAQRGERPLVSELAPAHHPVQTEHEIGAALVVTERLHEQRLTVGALGEVRSRAPSVETCLRELRERLPDCGEAVGDRLAGRPPGRSAEHDHHQRPGQPPTEHGAERVEGDLLRHEVDEGQREHEHPTDAASAHGSTTAPRRSAPPVTAAMPYAVGKPSVMNPSSVVDIDDLDAGLGIELLEHRGESIRHDRGRPDRQEEAPAAICV